MSYQTWTDGVSPLTADDLMALQEQTILRFATAAARSTALTGDTAPSTGMITQQLDKGTFERWDGAAWRVLFANRTRVAVSGTPPVTTDASASTVLTTFDLVSAGVYDLRGLLRTTAGTFKLTSLGSVTGFWTNLNGNTDAALFDRTSADAIVSVPLGISAVAGTLTASSSGTWTVYYYNQTSSAVLESGSFLELERTA